MTSISPHKLILQVYNCKINLLSGIIISKTFENIKVFIKNFRAQSQFNSDQAILIRVDAAGSWSFHGFSWITSWNAVEWAGIK